ncbi:MAG: hypothetical protein L0J57_00080 [Brachybacterium sp.]|nr:hypothetical protein [Brachybacterium sp.]
MSILDRLFTAAGSIDLAGDSPRRMDGEEQSYGPTLALGYPQRGKGWCRPWGRIETAVVSTRKSARTLSVQNDERNIAILTTDGLTPELLASKTWRRARSYRRGRYTDTFVFPFAAVLLLGALLLGTALHELASVLAVVVLLVLAVAAGIAGLFRFRAVAKRAAEELTEAGHDWREIELGEDDAIAHLLWALDALAFAWESNQVSEEVWVTARDLTRRVAEEARRGALIDDNNHDLCIAQDYIAAARAEIATSGQVDDLELPAPKNV